MNRNTLTLVTLTLLLGLGLGAVAGRHSSASATAHAEHGETAPAAAGHGDGAATRPLRLGLAGQDMHRDIVDDRKWVSEKDYLSALSFCMLLPGPEAMQLATWSGWRLRGTAGGLLAGLLLVTAGIVFGVRAVATPLAGVSTVK